MYQECTNNVPKMYQTYSNNITKKVTNIKYICSEPYKQILFVYTYTHITFKNIWHQHIQRYLLDIRGEEINIYNIIYAVNVYILLALRCMHTVLRMHRPTVRYCVRTRSGCTLRGSNTSLQGSIIQISQITCFLLTRRAPQGNRQGLN